MFWQNENFYNMTTITPSITPLVSFLIHSFNFKNCIAFKIPPNVCIHASINVWVIDRVQSSTFLEWENSFNMQYTKKNAVRDDDNFISCDVSFYIAQILPFRHRPFSSFQKYFFLLNLSCADMEKKKEKLHAYYERKIATVRKTKRRKIHKFLYVGAGVGWRKKFHAD